MVIPTVNDVILGKGAIVQQRPGNQRYRNFVIEMKADYDAAPKSLKSLYGHQIVSHINNLCPPGRFLKKCTKSGKLVEVKGKEALSKVRQALRDAKPGQKPVRMLQVVVTEVKLLNKSTR